MGRLVTDHPARDRLARDHPAMVVVVVVVVVVVGLLPVAL